MFKHYISILFPVIMCGNSIFSMDSINQHDLNDVMDSINQHGLNDVMDSINQHCLNDVYGYKKSKNYKLKSDFLKKDVYQNNISKSDNNYTIADFYNINPIYEKEIKQLKNDMNELYKRLYNVQRAFYEQPIKNKLRQNYTKTLEDNISKLKEKLSSVKMQLSTKENNINELNAENSKLKSEIQIKETKITDMNVVVNDLKYKLVSKDSKIKTVKEKFKTRIADKNSQIKNIKQKFSKINKHNKNLLLKQLSKKEIKIANMNIAINDLNHKLVSKDRKIEILKEKKAELKAKILNKDSQIKDLQKKLEEQTNYNQSILKQNQKLSELLQNKQNNKMCSIQ